MAAPDPCSFCNACANLRRTSPQAPSTDRTKDTVSLRQLQLVSESSPQVPESSTNLQHCSSSASPANVPKIQQQSKHDGASCNLKHVELDGGAAGSMPLQYDGLLRVSRSLAELHWVAGRPGQSIKWCSMAAATVEAAAACPEEAALQMQHHLCADEGELMLLL
jgi:hypothetical protein